MNLTLALLAVTAAIPVSLQPHSVKFYSFLVVAARPQPCRGGWRGESPALRNSRPGRRSREPWSGEMCQGAARSLCGLIQAGMLCAEGGTVLHVGMRSITDLIPSQHGSGPALPLCRGVVAGRCHCHPAWGTCLGSGQSCWHHSPAGCEQGPTTKLGAPP